MFKEKEPEKSSVMTVKLSERERRHLDIVAATFGTTKSDVFRSLLEAAYAGLHSKEELGDSGR